MDNEQIHISKKMGSPCIRNCCLDDNDICLGCLRTLKEICAWANLDSKERELIMEQVNSRKNAL
jgi:predicted Fe-S protein YdhL (DUF1289 family)